MGQLQWMVRIAVGVLCISWHMGHPPKAINYIMCGVMSFRPWQASCGPLKGLSRLRSTISPSSSLFLLCLPHVLCCSVPHCRIPFLHPVPILRFPRPPSSRHSSSSPPFHALIFCPSLCASSASWCMAVICDRRATEQRGTLQRHDPETPH